MSDNDPELKDAEWIVAQFSTQRNAISLDQITLIGLARRPGEETAILRLGSGEILAVKSGESCAAGAVVDIAEDCVLMLCDDGFRSLYLSRVG